jgi:hypothetical protein
MYWNFVAIDGVIKNQLEILKLKILKGFKMQVACKTVNKQQWINKTSYEFLLL